VNEDFLKGSAVTHLLLDADHASDGRTNCERSLELVLDDGDRGDDGDD
jgi:hypothetical protein